MVLSCGKKTDPIPKSQFIYPQEDKVTLEVTHKGVLITNIYKKYNLIVYKSLCENCGSQFKKIAVIEPEENYIDRDVVRKTPYFYQFIFKHSEYRVFSEPFVKRITYDVPIKVRSLQIIPISSKKIKINMTFNNTLHHYYLYLNNSLYYEGRDSSVEVELSDGTNSISILPFDIYNNKGELYTKKIDTYNLQEPEAVKNLNYVISGDKIYISWDPSRNAKKYRLKITINNRKNECFTEFNYYRADMVPNITCMDIEVTAENDYMISKSTKIRACRR
jgi:hypothetical protein